MDSIIFNILLFLVGGFLIIKCADRFVDSASWVATVLGVPKFIIGATIVSVGTTLPEITVSLISAAQGKVDMAIGNAIGSVTVNIAFILGLSIVLVPSVINKKDFTLKALLMIMAAAVLVLFASAGEYGIVPNIILVAIFAVFMFDNVRSGKRAIELQEASGKERIKPSKKETTFNVLNLTLGAVGVAIGAQLLVDNGSAIASFFGVPERVIAVTFVAIGTSLPELVTAITAIMKKESALSIGNIIGANVIDLALIVPLCSFVSGSALPISPAMASFDVPICLGLIVLTIFATFFTGKLQRWQGVLSITAYIGYLSYTLIAV